MKDGEICTLAAKGLSVLAKDIQSTIESGFWILAFAIVAYAIISKYPIKR